MLLVKQKQKNLVLIEINQIYTTFKINEYWGRTLQITRTFWPLFQKLLDGFRQFFEMLVMSS